MSLTVEEAQAIPVLWRGDVLVVGGGSAGCAAAIAAARSGARTLLVEAAGFLGGTGAAVLDTFYGFYAPGRTNRVVGGIGWELCERLLAREQAFERPNTYGAGTAGSSTIWQYVGGDGDPTGLTYGVPYRSLLPQNVAGLVVAGRCLSATHDAHASVRSMAQCMAMGQAAGTAAAIAASSGRPPADVDVTDLRGALEDGGAMVDQPCSASVDGRVPQ